MTFYLLLAVLAVGPDEFNRTHENPYKVGMSLAMKHGPERAEAYFRACHRQTGNKMCYYGLAYCLYLSYEHDKALKMVETITASGPHSEKFSGHLAMLTGLIRHQNQEFELAEKPFEKALFHYENDGHTVNIFKTLTAAANVKLALGKMQEAKQLLEQANYIAIQEDVNLSYLHSLRAIAYYTSGNLEAAEQFAILSVEEYKALENTPAVMGMLSWLAFYRYEQGKNEEAKATLETALHMSKKHSLIKSTELIKAYIYKCENPVRSNQLFQKKASVETDYFALRFLQTALEKECN